MKLLKSNSKLFLFPFGLFIALSLLLMLFFMTQYANIHVLYTFNAETGEVEINPSSSWKVGEEYNNESLAKYFNSTTKPTTPFDGQTFDDVKYTIYNFQMGMNSLNDFIVIVFVVSLCMFALMLVFANHSRNIYYNSNLAVGIGAPLVVAIMSLIAIIKTAAMLGDFNTNLPIYQATAVMQLHDGVFSESDKFVLRGKNGMPFEDMVAKYAPNVNSATLILTIIYFVLLIVFTAVVIAHTVMKYLATKERRNEVIARARGVQYEQ